MIACLYYDKRQFLFSKHNHKAKRFSPLQVLGKDKLGNLMVKLMKEAGLSQKYTNHSIRVTEINRLHESRMCK